MEIKTNAKLLEALKAAASQKPTADELREQRVSFIYGSMKADSGVTRAKIEQLLDEHAGVTAK